MGTFADSFARRTRHLSEMDWMMAAVVSLCCLGLTMAVSIQGVGAEGPLLAMKGQAGKLLVGLIAFLIGAMISLDFVRRTVVPGFIVLLLLSFYVALFGQDINGASRWLRIAGFSIQPVEPARFLLIVLCARLLAEAGASVHRFKEGFLPVLCAGVALAAPLLLQPDVGNAVFALVLVSCLSLTAGVRLRWFLLVSAPALLLMVAAMSFHNHVSTRLSGFFSGDHPEQVKQSIVAISSGGVFGRGLGDGWMKMGYVAEPHNDFVFAMIGEELGLLGCSAVLLLYILFGFMGLKIAIRLEDPFRRFLVVGFTLTICLQAMINLLVVTGMAPAKGIDLPFLSSGGTGLVMALAGVGIIGNAARTDPSSPGFARTGRHS